MKDKDPYFKFKSIFFSGLGLPAQGIKVAVKKCISMERKELEILAKLNHPNIIPLLGVCDKEPDFFLILELCHSTLYCYLYEDKDNKPLSEDEAFTLAKQVATGLKYLREEKILHRDVKSPNILIAGDFTAKLADFGLAKDIEQTITTATTSGSLKWMAPEVLTHCKLSPEYDIYSFGIVLGELVSRQVPFSHYTNRNAIIFAVCSKDERPPIPEECSLEITRLIARCVDKDRTKRPQIDEIIQVLEGRVGLYVLFLYSLEWMNCTAPSVRCFYPPFI